MKKAVAIGLFALASCAQADDRFANVEVKATQVAGSVYMLTGSGGNIGVSAGEDGLLMIDDQYAPLAEKIAATLSELGDKSPRYIVNTHYHGDHTGSNAFFHENRGATIFSHENVRIRLASADDADPASLPVVTYQDGIKFHMNNDIVHVFHLPDAHTDGDSAVWFEQADVLHAGDFFFNKIFPYIDLGAGGTVKGYIAAIEVLLSKIEDDTQVIPGHGPLASKQDLAAALTMIKETYAYVQEKKSAGMTEQEVLDLLSLNPYFDIIYP